MISDQTTPPHRIYLLVLSVTVLCVYFAALNAGYLPIDDGKTLQFVQSGQVSISGLFLKGGKEYFRPLAMLSLVGDSILFNGKLAGYHLVNIFIHTVNTLLVYYLAIQLFGKKQNSAFYSFLTALIFAVHPVNAETVCWISARPDLLCCFFSLITLILVIRTSTAGKPFLYFLLSISFLCSLLAKEASFFLPLLIAFWFFQERKNIPAQNALTSLTAIALTFSLYVLLRKGLPLASDSVQTAALAQHSAPITLAKEVVTAFGFYIQKLFYPFPLNFAIVEVDTTMTIALFFFFIVIATLLWIRETSLRFPIFFLSVSLIPPIGAMLLFTIWTPYAERYLYQPSIAFALGFTLLLSRFEKQVPRKAALFYILLLAIPTAWRVSLWTDPLLFWQDTVNKSPNFGNARLVLAWEYLQAGQYAKAENNLQVANQLDLPRKARDSSVQIRKELNEKTRTKSRTPVVTPDTSEPLKSFSPF